MTPTKEELQEYAQEAKEVADKMQQLAYDLAEAAEDRISPNDCDLSGAFAAAEFTRQVLPIIERF